MVNKYQGALNVIYLDLVDMYDDPKDIPYSCREDFDDLQELIDIKFGKIGKHYTDTYNVFKEMLEDEDLIV